MNSRPVIRSCRRICGSAGTDAGGHGHQQNRTLLLEKTCTASYTDTHHQKINWMRRKKSTVPGSRKPIPMATYHTPRELEYYARNNYQRKPSPAYEIRDRRLLYGMQRLTPHQLSIVECRIYGVLTFRQIGELLHLDPHNVQHSYWRAVDRMRTVVEQWGVAPTVTPPPPDRRYRTPQDREAVAQQRRQAVARVAEMRTSGMTWNDIGEVLGINGQTAKMLWYERER